MAFSVVLDLGSNLAWTVPSIRFQRFIDVSELMPS